MTGCDVAPVRAGRRFVSAHRILHAGSGGGGEAAFVSDEAATWHFACVGPRAKAATPFFHCSTDPLHPRLTQARTLDQSYLKSPFRQFSSE